MAIKLQLIFPMMQKKENEVDNIGTAYIMNGSLYNTNWYVPDVSNDTQYFSFTNSKI